MKLRWPFVFGFGESEARIWAGESAGEVSGSIH